MRLGDLVDISELRGEIENGYISIRHHPALPLAILNYTNQATFDNRWSDTITHCRGLIIDSVVNHEPCSDCNIIARPFHKFFNINQSDRPETLESNLPHVIPTITEKMDGWFGILWKCEYEGQIHYGIASRGSFESPGAVFATGKLPKLIKYGAIDEFPKGYTPIFEIIFKAGKIVVDYPYEGLVLLALVNNETGEELPYDELQAVWAKIAGYATDNRPWIRLVKAHRMSVDDCLISNEKNFEGFVLSYPRPGTRPIKVKIKLDDYKRLHKLITGVTPQQIWRAIHDPMAPWLGNEVPDHFRKWAVTWRDELYNKFHKELQIVMELAKTPMSFIGLLVGTMDDKTFRKARFERLNEIDSQHATITTDLLDGRIYQAHQAIWKQIRPRGRDDVFYREGSGE